MKAEHRHELKTNTLADWLSHSPQWAKENLLSIVIVVATVFVLSGYFFWRGLAQDAKLHEQYRFTGIANQISTYKMQILGSQGQEMGRTPDLFEPATSLATFANSTADDNLGALAFIKHAETLRSQLHYRTESVSPSELASQIGDAQESYKKALKKSGDNVSLAAAAKFGLALCEEELGNFEEARKIYTEIADDSAYEGTVSVNQARLRLDTMADFEADVAFMPRPKPKPIEIEPVTIDFPPTDPNKPGAATQPKVTFQPADANAPVLIKKAVVEPNAAATEPKIKVVPPETETKGETPAVTVKTQDSNSTPKVIDPNASSR